LSEADIAISLSIKDLSIKPERQYLKIVTSDIGLLPLGILLKGEFLSSVLSESEGESSVSSRFSGRLSKLLPNSFSTYQYI
jgi:hypothetical protein